ncbi:MAG: conjugal transfer protein TraM [Nitrosomonas sp. PRO4]|nr:conjugal transfer protein TraM [Nitrosomonas sp. PRO4]
MTMTDLDHFSKIIERVAAKHGIALTDDDPILMIHTLNEILLEENNKAHQVLLNNFRSTLEENISQWSQATENKANSLLQASSRNTHLLTEQIINACFESIDQKIESGFNEKIKEVSTLARSTWQAAIINLLATSLFFIAVLVMVLVF